METNNKEIYTIGHSTHSIQQFIAMLLAFEIETVIDVRHFPGSRKFPQFNKDELSKSLKQSNIDYLHVVELGGRRKPSKESKNTAWRHPAFRAYADYMETDGFSRGMNILSNAAERCRTAYMCSEAV